jgi:fatty-acyl-CoA synthase
MSSTDDALELRCSTVGRTMPATEIRIANPNNNETVARGEVGELRCKGFGVMKGYDADPKSTAEVFDPDGWLCSGDLAVMREDGYIRITGRLKDMILRGGENIYPREIEEFLYTHPKVADVQVIGIPDKRLGEVVSAWIVLKPGQTADEAEIKGFCQGQIAYFKIPAYVRFVDAFPLTVTGKVQKFRMREIEIEERGLADAAATETA